MPQVTGLTAERMLAIEAASITQAEIDGDNLVLKNHAGATVLNVNVRGPQGIQGIQGDPGDVASGGYVGTLQDAVDEAAGYSDSVADLSGRGLVAMAEYSAADLTKVGGDDSWHDVTNVTPTFSFVAGRSYEITFGMLAQFGALSTIDNVLDLELREGTNVLRRVSVQGDTEGRTKGITGTHTIKSCVWSGNKTLNMRFRKATGADVTIYNTYSPSFIAINDLGNRFAP